MPDTAFNLSRFLPYQLAVLSARTSRLLSTIYDDSFGLTVPEWRVLVHVARCEKVSVREIHNCVNLEKPTVSRAAKRLEADGLIAKSQSTQDQRLVEIRLTPAGEEVLNRIIPEALRLESRLMSGFTPEEQVLLQRMMERLHQTLDGEPEAPRRSRMDVEPPDQG